MTGLRSRRIRTLMRPTPHGLRSIWQRSRRMFPGLTPSRRCNPLPSSKEKGRDSEGLSDFLRELEAWKT